MQPLVENAIRHGISKRREGGTVTVTARRENELLRISVEDDGVGLPADWTPGASEGLGLSVTRQRVMALAGGSPDSPSPDSRAARRPNSRSARVPAERRHARGHHPAVSNGSGADEDCRCGGGTCGVRHDAVERAVEQG